MASLCHRVCSRASTTSPACRCLFFRVVAQLGRSCWQILVLPFRAERMMQNSMKTLSSATMTEDFGLTTRPVLAPCSYP